MESLGSFSNFVYQNLKSTINIFLMRALSLAVVNSASFFYQPESFAPTVQQTVVELRTEVEKVQFHFYDFCSP